MKIKMSCDDGGASDKRLAELAEKHDVECIFYWPVEWHSLAYSKGYEPLLYKDAGVIANRHEIGSHGVTHRYLTQIPEHEAEYEIEQSKKMLEDMFMIKVTKFAPPRGYTNEKLTEFTKLFYKKQRLTKGDGLVHIHPDSGANGNIGWQDRAKILADNGIEIECWMHSWELDKYNLWDELDEYLSTHS